MFPFNLLFLVLNRAGEQEKQPWQKGNSWIINTGVNISFIVSKVYYRNAYAIENINVGITDISFTVTKTGENPL